ncbi:MAG: T9SS type A sorting domain-containing protein, partial [Bacteroidota bacterium]
FWMKNCNFIGNNTLMYCRHNGCNNGGQTRNNVNVPDYGWQVDHCFSNSLVAATINTLSGSIRNVYYTGAVCTNTGVIPSSVPFHENNVTINDDLNYLPCQVRFTNDAYRYPNTYFQLFSDQVDPIEEPVIPACSGVGNFAEKNSYLINNEVNLNELEVSPIPASTFISIKRISKGEVVGLYDVLGNLIINKIATGESLQFDLNEVTDGIYFLSSQNHKPVKIIRRHEISD